MAPTTPKTKAKKKPVSEVAKMPITDEDREPGIVYIGHVPHGFFEHQIRKYFSQFGKVMAVKLSRSKKTGKSKGYAFVKFRYAAVAKTVAETCNNYLFFDKILKCEYRKLDEMHEGTFFNYKWKPNNKPKRQHNSDKTVTKLRRSLNRSVKQQAGKLKSLEDLGIKLSLEDIMTIPEVKTQPAPEDSSEKTKGSEVKTGSEDTTPKTAMPKSKRAKKETPTPKGKQTEVETLTPTPKSKKAKKETPTPKGKQTEVETPTPTPKSKKAKKETPTPKGKQTEVETPTPTPKSKKAKKETLTPKGKQTEVETPTPTPKSKQAKIETPTPTPKGKQTKKETPTPTPKGKQAKKDTPTLPAEEATPVTKSKQKSPGKRSSPQTPATPSAKGSSKKRRLTTSPLEGLASNDSSPVKSARAKRIKK